ncbi:MAG: hypothetical protein JWQ70_788 [Aeromicrobium sp.]|jgi:hypothetical protein|nr:hypothetical protein [Aeromicrobium sp.]
MFTINPRKNRTVLVALTAILVVIGGSLAYAYWTSSGSGVGSGTTGTSTDFTVASTAATGPLLKPGVGQQSIAFTVTNPSTASQTLSLVTVTVANSDGSPWILVPGCSAADYTVGTPAITYGPIPAPGNAAGTVTLVMKNLPTNQDACKGATVPLYFAAS